MSPAPKPARCRGCKAAILWIQTPKQKWMPCDPELVTGRLVTMARQGDVILVREDGTTVPAIRAVGAGALVEGYLPHWASCPKRKDFVTRVPIERRGQRE